MTDLELPSDRVDEIVDELDLSNEAGERAMEIAENADYHAKVNRTPSVVAASAVYLAALLVNEKRTQAEVGAVAGVSEPPIRECYPTLVEIEGFRMPKRLRSEDSETDLEPDGLFGRAKRRFGR